VSFYANERFHHHEGKMFHRTRNYLLSAFCVAIVTASLAAQPKTLTILHTNDMHAAFIPHEATWRRENPKPLVGGFKELEFVVDSIRKVKPHVLLLDAGDVMTGTPIADHLYKGAEGGALFEMMNVLGYDAWAIGNHDFDISQENLVKLTKIAKFPSLSANLVNTEGAFPVNNRDYVIVNRGGLRIGVFGLMAQGLYSLVNPNNLVGIKVLSPVETARRMIETLDPKTDLIIALTHQGVDEDSVLAANVRGLDVIVGGHSHTRLTKPKVVNGVIIVQAGSRCENVGELEVTVEHDSVVRYTGKLLPLWANPNRPRTKLGAFVDSMQAEIEKEYSEVVARLESDWVRARGESNIGQFITDAQRRAAHAQVAFMNASGIRANVAAGPLTKLKLFEVLPFRNILTTFQLSGKQLRHVLLHTLNNDEAVLFSGVRATVKKLSDSSWNIVEFTVDGKPVEEEWMYICAASDFMVAQAKKYFGLEIQQPFYLQQTVFQAVEREARKAGVIAGTVEERIRVIP
jgi:5'-nucleotidase/UDP-sugar diphosphatase